MSSTLRQILEARLEYRYTTAHANLSENALDFCVQSLQEISQVLVEAMSQLWKECTTAIKLLKPAQGVPINRKMPLTMVSFWQALTAPTMTRRLQPQVCNAAIWNQSDLSAIIDKITA